jgi:hypothetical protein
MKIIQDKKKTIAYDENGRVIIISKNKNIVIGHLRYLGYSV